MTDLRYALRMIARAPALTAVIVVSLALGVGANTVLFSWLKEARLNPLPGVAPETWLLETRDDTGTFAGSSWTEYRDLVPLLPSFEGVAAQRVRSLYLGTAERNARVFTEFVSANFFSILGVQPQLGRFFRADEAAAPGGAPVAVIGHDFWQRQFQGDAAVLGRTLQLNGHTFTVVGVAPPGFHGAYNHLVLDVFVPATMATVLIPATSELRNREHRAYNLLARLRPGATLAQARGELDRAARHLLETFPETNRGLGFELLPPWRSPRGGASVVTSLATLQVFGLLILVVVCANTANLLLARASTRHREIGVRLAIGAGPGRILAQLLTESVVVALLGAAGGLLVALWGIDLLGQIPVPGGLPIRLSPALDWSAVLFAAAVGTGCGLAFGLAPALQLARRDVSDALRGGRSGLGGRSHLRDLLIGLEVATALIVLVLAGLYLKSLHNARTLPTGFDADRVLLFNVDLGGRGYTRETAPAFLDDLLSRLASLPGVEHVSASNLVPLDVRGLPTGVTWVEGQNPDPDRKILYSVVTPDYFATLGIPLVDGADLSPMLRRDLPDDAVISEEMARRYWPGQNPIGRRFEVNGTTCLIRGVAKTPQLETIGEAPRPAAWMTFRSQFVAIPVIHLRVREGDPTAIVPLVRDTVRRLDPELPMLEVRTLAQSVDTGLFRQRVAVQLLGVLGPLALGLAAIGLYAVIAYAVAQRTQEIGVRLTLGAMPQSIVGLMMWQSLRVVLVALAAGLAVALVAGWYLRHSFVRVPFGDPVIYAGMPLLLLAVATLACFLPARRATKVDPMVALRSE